MSLPTRIAPRHWHILQISGAIDLELGEALAEAADVIGWQPERTLLPTWRSRGQVPATATANSSRFSLRPFPLVRGFARRPVSMVARTGPTVARLLAAHTPDARRDVLVCTAPYFAPVAERWPGPVVYWLTDRIASYSSSRGIDVPALDRRMCRSASLVCPNSRRLAEYLVAEAGCDPGKIAVVPNATREDNLQPHATVVPEPLPAPAQGLLRPVIGVIGNMAGNLDWTLLQEAVERTPHLDWLFVGPTSMDMADAIERRARAAVMAAKNTLFVGAQPYPELVRYARGFHVAMLPYKRCEPTYSGSSTRFYEHLAACRPMIATRGFEELLHKEPLLKLVDTGSEVVGELARLQQGGFTDGVEELRWHSSRSGTWHCRARQMRTALEQRLNVNGDRPAKETAAARMSEEPTEAAA